MKTKTEKEFENLVTLVKENITKPDIKKIESAWKFAQTAHAGQRRLSGEEFIMHPLEVAKILATWRLDTTSIVAALLHDTIEDGGVAREDIVKKFGEDVARLVDGVTKVTTLRLKGSVEKEYVENLRKMLLVMAKDIRVILIKLADRLHNMKTLSALPVDKQKENAVETLEIYAPLAERLGIGEIKGQLEDLAFPFVYPQEYKKTVKRSKIYYKKAEERIRIMKRNLLRKLAKEGITAEIHGRKKHLYSLWKKLARSDFIAQPKPNGYQSIHTKVFGSAKGIVEVQIRTRKMHEQAEFGVASHWAYSDAKSEGAKDSLLEKRGIKVDRKKLHWVKQLIKWREEINDTKEFLRAVKFDALHHRNFIFSPMGDVYDLPSGATPVDFAYAIHSGLGNFAKGALVDGKMVPLDYKLKSGEVVEILKSKKPNVNRGWLEFVVTNTARREISKYLKNHEEKR